MGRKSALTPEQWAEVEHRHLINGESINSLAKEFGVNEATIRKKINPNKSEQEKSGKSLQVLAVEKIEAEKTVRDISEQIAALPMVRQATFNSLVTKLTNISSHIASAAEYGAATAHRLSALAHAEVEKIDDASPLTSGESLRGIAALTSLANESGKIALNLLSANKDKPIGAEEKPTMTLDDFYGGAKP
ncbi:helix-turn-helix domain-containing protein [Burkholderia pseudomallei]|uniref:helix-turn-helix domain-containing protein n=1 Tax=Burkholderia pseudomallei TaxID=28450 RepID=UPI0004822573|nr:helix-turn-helix domain-containing protein [Burkholderia pseudomallei]